MRNLITTIDELGPLWIDFISYENQFDTSVPTGKIFCHVTGAVTEFEKDIIRDQAKALYAEGLFYRAIGHKLKMAESTILNWLISK